VHFSFLKNRLRQRSPIAAKPVRPSIHGFGGEDAVLLSARFPDSAPNHGIHPSIWLIAP
jgi:hypothetical protein